MKVTKKRNTNRGVVPPSGGSKNDRELERLQAFVQRGRAAQAAVDELVAWAPCPGAVGPAPCPFEGKTRGGVLCKRCAGGW